MGNPNQNGKKISALAVASIVLGVLGMSTLVIIGGLLLAGAGAVMGHLAIHDIRYSGGNLKGKRLARAGLVISYLAMFAFPIVMLSVSFSFPMVQQFRDTRLMERAEASRINAARLYNACEEYSKKHQGRYPKNWGLLAGGYIPESELREILTGIPGQTFKLIPHERPVLKAVASSVVVIQEKAPPGIKKVAIVHADGSVKMIQNPDRR